MQLTLCVAIILMSSISGLPQSFIFIVVLNSWYVIKGMSSPRSFIHLTLHVIDISLCRHIHLIPLSQSWSIKAAEI